MDRLSMPSCASLVVSVAAIIAYGAPDESPKNSAASGAASVYWRRAGGNALRHPPGSIDRCVVLNRMTPARERHGLDDAERPALGTTRAVVAALELPIVVDRERRVVREAPVLVDRGAFDRGAQRGAHDLVVDAPPHVLLPSAAAARPPRVLIRRLVHRAKRVDEPAAVEQRVEPSALRWSEPRIVLKCAPIFQVDRTVRHVEVTAEYERQAVAREVREPPVERGEEPELGFLPRRAGGARRKVRARDRNGAEVRLEIAAFRVELRHTDAAHHVYRLATRVDCDAAVSWFLRGVQHAMKAARLECAVGELMIVSLELLHAEHVRALAREPAEESFACRAAQTVRVKTDHSHGGKSADRKRSALS